MDRRKQTHVLDVHCQMKESHFTQDYTLVRYAIFNYLTDSHLTHCPTISALDLISAG